MGRRASRKDILNGLVFIGFGLAFAVTASTYEVGTAVRMGPGYFPLVLGGLLALLGILIVVKGFVAPEAHDEFGPVPWKALVLLVGALLFFGFTVRGLGLVPSLFVAVFLAAMAGRNARLISALVVAVSLTALSILIFVMVLQLRLPLVGPWLQG